MFKRPPPIEDELAALQSPAGVAARRKRCEQWADELRTASGPGRRPIATDPYARVVYAAGTAELSEALAPLRFDGSFIRPTESENRAAEQQAQRNVDALVVRQLEISEQARETQAVHNQPDRMEYARIWSAYARSVESLAFTKGRKEPEFVGRFQALMAERNDAESYDDEAAVRSVEARLDRLTAPVRFPQLPESAWRVADLLPTTDRQAELDRLDAKYGPRNPSTNGTAVTKFRNRRETRPRSALNTR
jgi:hypothetical protein